MARHTAHIFIDGHFIIIKDNNHRLAAFRCVAQTLVNHAARGCSVTQKGNNLVIMLLQGARPCHTQRNRHRAGSVTGHKRIAIALGRLWKSSNAAVGAQCIKIRPATGQQLMHIRLVTNIKYQAVCFSIKYSLDRHCQLYNTQIGC